MNDIKSEETMRAAQISFEKSLAEEKPDFPMTFKSGDRIPDWLEYVEGNCTVREFRKECTVEKIENGFNIIPTEDLNDHECVMFFKCGDENSDLTIIGNNVNLINVS